MVDDDAGTGAAVQAKGGFIDDAGFAVGGELDVGGEGSGEELRAVLRADDPAEFEVADGFGLPIVDVDAGRFGFVAGDGGEAVREFDGGVRESKEGELDLAVGLVDGGRGVGCAREGATAGDLDVEAGPVLETGDGGDEFALEGVRAAGFEELLEVFAVATGLEFPDGEGAAGVERFSPKKVRSSKRTPSRRTWTRGPLPGTRGRSIRRSMRTGKFSPGGTSRAGTATEPRPPGVKSWARTRSVTPRMRLPEPLRRRRPELRSRRTAPPRAVALEPPRSKLTRVTGESAGKLILNEDAGSRTVSWANAESAKRAKTADLIQIDMVYRDLAGFGVCVAGFGSAFGGDGNEGDAGGGGPQFQREITVLDFNAGIGGFD